MSIVVGGSIYLFWNPWLYYPRISGYSLVSWAFLPQGGTTKSNQSINRFPFLFFISILPMQEPQEIWVWSLGQEDPLEKGMATNSRLLARIFPRTEEPRGLQSIRLHRVGHEWALMHYYNDCVRLCQTVSPLRSPGSLRPMHHGLLLPWCLLIVLWPQWHVCLQVLHLWVPGVITALFIHLAKAPKWSSHAKLG